MPKDRKVMVKVLVFTSSPKKKNNEEEPVPPVEDDRVLQLQGMLEEAEREIERLRAKNERLRASNNRLVEFVNSCHWDDEESGKSTIKKSVPMKSKKRQSKPKQYTYFTRSKARPHNTKK